MRSIYILGFIFCWLTFVKCVPVEVIYTGDSCDCPKKLDYYVNVPKIPKPKKYAPCDYGYKVDVPIQAKAKVSYTFDFNVEEPRPPCPEKQDKLNLYTKIDRIAMNRADCPVEYTKYPQYPQYPPPQHSTSCSCDQCGASKSPYRYVNRKLPPCKCQQPKCKCNYLTRRQTQLSPNAISSIQTPIVIASGSLEEIRSPLRRKRDLERIFFRPRRQQLKRPARYIKSYNKKLTDVSKATQPQGWFDVDLLAETNPFKRKTKKAFFQPLHSRIVKRDIKGEYDMLEKERQEADLTLPEIIQFMPETLQPNFKRGPCKFCCGKPACSHKSEEKGNTEDPLSTQREENFETTTQAIETTTNAEEKVNEVDSKADESNSIENSYTKRNAGNYQHYLFTPAAVSPISFADLTSSIARQNDYAAQAFAPVQYPTNPNYDDSGSQLSPCEQRKVYARMRQASEQKFLYDTVGPHRYEDNSNNNNGDLNLLVSPSSTVPDPSNHAATPLQYTGDLEIPQVGYRVQSYEEPTLAATPYPVQHISSGLLDRIISDIVHRHPDFVDATSHYGGALVDPEPYQEQQTKDFIKKLVHGRLNMFFAEPENAYTQYYNPSHRTSHNPFHSPAAFTYVPSFY